MGWKRLATIILTLVVTLSAPARAGAATTPPRLAFVDGDVSFWRPGAEDWAPAKVNTPLAAGDSLYTGDDANLELQVGPSAFVRAGAGTDLGLESLESDLQQFKLTSGHVAVDVRRRPRGQAIEIDTPNGALTIDRPGYYRADVVDDRTTFSARRGGQATLVPANGEATDVEPDKQVVLKGTDTPELATNAAPDPDEWDRWNLDRGQPAKEPSRSAQYVPPDVAGGEDLDRYGDWRETPRYGHVWVPHEVAPEWAPYSTGRWVWDPYYGWTWVDDAPWGWAPYHYGRWVYVDGFWGWAPGPVVVAPVYAPALVAFFGGPHVSVGVGVPFPFVSWVALGFGEPLIPWWGPVGFAGTCWWGGWGGPHIVNNVVIQKNVYVNVRNVTVFRNQKVKHAMMAVQRDHFGQGRIEHVHLADADARRLRPIRGPLGVKPTPASLVAREGHGRRPPESAHARPVVATRPPQDPTRRLHAAGLNDVSNTMPPPRLVRPERQQGGHPTPPPHPGIEHRRAGEGPSRAVPPPPRAHAGGEDRQPEASRRPHGPPHGAEGRAPVDPRRVEQPAPPVRQMEPGRPATGAPREPRQPLHAPSHPGPHRGPHEVAPGPPPSAYRSASGPPLARRPAHDRPGPGRARAARPQREAGSACTPASCRATPPDHRLARAQRRRPHAFQCVWFRAGRRFAGLKSPPV